jgi:putative membrane protein
MFRSAVALVAAVCAFTAPAGAQDPAARVKDALFVYEASLANMAAIQLAQLAIQNAATDKAREFANATVEQQSAAQRDLAQLAAAEGILLPERLQVPPPGGVDPVSEPTILFDVTYLNRQVVADARTIALYREQARNGTDPELRAFAQKRLPALREHIQEARAALRLASRLQYQFQS